jgi:hypothetical protein
MRRTIIPSSEKGGPAVKKSYMILWILVAVFAAGGITNADDDDQILRFKANLSGDQEVTKTRGTITVSFNKALSELEFVLEVRAGVDVLQAHLHCGRPGQNGPVVVFLFPVGGTAALLPPGVDVDGRLARGTLTNDNVRPSAANCNQPPPVGIERPVNNIASLFFAAKDGLIYANVHTVEHTSGEVRGQLIEVSEND